MYEKVAVKEYWTPSEAALILGRGPGFWRNAFKEGLIEGYQTNGRVKPRLYLLASSARDYLRKEHV